MHSTHTDLAGSQTFIAPAVQSVSEVQTEPCVVEVDVELELCVVVLVEVEFAPPDPPVALLVGSAPPVPLVESASAPHAASDAPRPITSDASGTKRAK
jgi:hypothetical protein